MLDVGQGDAFLLRSPAGRLILIDTGPSSAINQQLGQHLPWWQKKIDLVIISHAHLDHFGGLLSLLESYEVSEVWFNGEQNSDNDQYVDLLDKLKQKNINTKVVKRGQRSQFDNLQIDVIWPREQKEDDSNNQSLVLRLTYGAMDVIFAGDISSEVEQQLLGDQLEAEVLKVAHHGSRSSSATEFLTQVRPEFCLISAGLDNQYKHPHAEAINRLNEAGCAVLSSSHQGAVELRISTSTIAVSATLPAVYSSGILNPK